MFFISINEAGEITGRGESNMDFSHRKDRIKCSEAEFHAFTDYVVKNGVLSLVQGAPLERAKKEKIAEMSKACERAILAGFKSNAVALGMVYPFKEKDQANLNGSVVSSLLPNNAVGWTTPFWCADATGKWDFRMHTAQQIQQVGKDGKNHLLACMNANAVLAAEAMAATIPAELESITWTYSSL